MNTELIQGNAIEVLAKRPAKSIDMIYSDPPFNTGQIWKTKVGSFDDRWSRNSVTDSGWTSLQMHCSAGAAALSASAANQPSLHAYLGMMAGLLVASRRSLKLTGTLWLHFDDHAGAYLRVLLDVVFGGDAELGTLIWKRSSGAAITRGFQRVHDTIAVYARSRAARYRLWRIGKMHACPIDADACRPFHDFVDDRLHALGQTDAERVGYPTQKPVDLIAHFIEMATFPGDMVCDPTMGSGTTIVACEKTNRRGIGIDLSADAISVAAQRVRRAPKHQFDMFGAMT